MGSFVFLFVSFIFVFLSGGSPTQTHPNGSSRTLNCVFMFYISGAVDVRLQGLGGVGFAKGSSRFQLESHHKGNKPAEPPFDKQGESHRTSTCRPFDLSVCFLAGTQY